MANKVLSIEFRAKDATSAALKQLGLNADQAARKVREVNNAGKGKSKGKGFDVESIVGEDRQLNKLVQGGAVALIGDQLANATGKMVELSSAFRKGQLDASGLAVKIGESLPIIGGFVTAGQNIRELFTSEQAAIDKVNESSKAQNQLTEYQNSLYQQQKKRIQEIGNALRDIANRRANVGLEGYALGQNQQTQGAQKRLTDITQKRDAELDANRTELTKKLSDISDQAMRKELDAGLASKLRSSLIAAAKKNEADINGKYANLSFQERQTSAAELLDWQRKQNEQSAKLVNGHEQEITNIQAKARQERLKALGLSGAAELDQIKVNADAQKQAVLQQYEEERKTVAPALAQSLEAQKNRRLKAIDDEAQAARDASQYQTRQTINQQLRQQKQASLDFGVDAAGTPAQQLQAKRAAERFKLQTEAIERKKQLDELMANPFASDAEKQAGVQGLQQFLASSGKAFDLATMGKAPDVQHLFNAQESIGLTGVSAAGKEHTTQDDYPQRAAKASEQATKVQSELLSQFKQYFQWLQQQKQMQPTTGTSTGIFGF